MLTSVCFAWHCWLALDWWSAVCTSWPALASSYSAAALAGSRLLH